MIRHSRVRSSSAGITLVEILISILIMGIGLISVASLFPIALLRVRDAQRNQRSVLLAKSAESEILARDMLNLQWFTNSYYAYDPFAMEGIQGGANLAAFPGYGPGLPICYDPLWWEVVDQSRGVNPSNFDGRFGAATDLKGNAMVRSTANEQSPSAFGLPRLTNFMSVANPAVQNLANYGVIWPFTYPIGTVNSPDVGGQIFASQDDPVLQKDGPPSAQNPQYAGVGSPIIPAFTPINQGNGVILPQTSNDWQYSWMFTGRRTDVNDLTVYNGEIVLFQNRAFGIAPVSTPNGGALNVPIGERVVEAIFGYSTAVNPYININGGSYGIGDARIVLLRWPANQEDPKGLSPGHWIADVTYERYQSRLTSKFGPQNYPGQRCYWYRIAKVDPVSFDPIVPGYRRKIITLATPVQAKTLITQGGEPVYVNVALINPYVVNVIPRVFYSR
ncbi:MAG: hypothetical protein NVSMB14_03170 [Isosphaeraceae bacterium]